MRILASCLFLVTLLSACGGETDSSTGSISNSGGSSGQAGAGGGGQAGESQGGAGGGSAGTGGSGGQDACSVETAEKGPYTTTFALKNSGTKPVYLWQECLLDVAITACASSYTTPLVVSASCSSDCENFMGCLQCGACFSGPLEVPPGEQKEFIWSGSTYTFDQIQGCQCHHTKNAPAGKYRIAVSVWDTKPEEFQPKPTPERTVSVDFDLHLANAQIDVALQP